MIQRRHNFLLRYQLTVGLSLLIGLAGGTGSVSRVTTRPAQAPLQALELAQSIETTPIQPPDCTKADVNEDGLVNVVDVAVVGLRAGNSMSVDIQTVALIGLCYDEPALPGISAPAQRQGPRALPDAAAVAPHTSLGVSPQSSQINANQVFEVSIAISTNVPTRAAQFGLSFDPVIVRCNEMSEGPFHRDWALAHGGSTVIFLTPACNNTQGIVSDMGVLIFGTEAGGPQGNGTVARVRFTAIAEGLSPLNLTHVQVLDGAISPQPLSVVTTNGQAIVGVVPGGQTVNVDVYATVPSLNNVYLPLVAKSAPIIMQSSCGSECDAWPQRMTPDIRRIVEWLITIFERSRGVLHD